MKLWPDLSRFGWQLGVLYRELPEGKRQASGLYIESVGNADTGKVAAVLSDAGFVPVESVGESPFRMESERTKFTMNDLQSWFPGFDVVADMRERHPVFMVAQPATAITNWFFDFNWPRAEDLEAVDSLLNLHGWEYPAEAFERVAAERVLRLDANGQVVDPELSTERVLDILYGPGELQMRRAAIAERLLGRIAIEAHQALKSASVVAIEKVGDKVLMPALRVFRDGEAITSAFADHRRLVETALPDYPVPDEALKSYQEDPAGEANDLDVLDWYPEDHTIEQHYDYDDDFAGALTRLIPGFEYPNFSHMTIGQVKAVVARKPATEVKLPPPVASENSDDLVREIENLRQIGAVSRRLGLLAFDLAAMASSALRESGRLEEVFVTGDALADPGIPALQKALEETGPFTEQHMALTEILQIEVRRDVEDTLANEVMPVYRVAEHMCVAVHPSARKEGMIQVTRYAKDGIIGDSQYNNLADAIRSEGLWFAPRLASDEATKVIEQSINAEAAHQAWREQVEAEGKTSPVADPVEVEVLNNPKIRRSRKSQAEDRIDDVGEKIGGARKDFYKRALSIADLPSMNDLEKKELVKKANIWPWSVKEALEKGVEPCVIQWIKTLRRHIREFGDTARYMPNQEPEVYINGVAMLRDAVGEPKTRAELAENIKAFRLRLYEEGLWMPFDHPVTGERVSSSRYYEKAINAEVMSVGQRAFDMVDNSARRPYISETRSYSAPEFTPAQWYNSKAEYFEKNPEYGRSRLMPTRRVVTKEDTDIVIPERPHLDNLVHSGFSDVRGGRDIDATELLSKFGFRAIEFGNWVPQDERQSVINLAYDGMHALCETLGMEPKMASLHGELALAFGSRGRGGKGAAVAHYEPSRKVINLTRIKGAGALAHEWKHAFDNRLGELFAKAPGGYLCDASLGALATRRSAEEMRGEGISPERIESFLANGSIDPTPIWRETAQAMYAVLHAMQTREKASAAIVQEAQALLDCRMDWAASWIRNDLVSYFREKAGNDPDALQGAYKAGITTAQEIVEKAVADHAKLLYSGGWQAFPASVVAEQIRSEVRVDYGIKLGRKAMTNMEGCLHTASRNRGIVEMAKFSPEERAAFLIPKPGVPLHTETIFDLPKAMDDSHYLANAKKLDKARSKGYWATPRELLARAGEQYIFYAMQENGCQSDYLVHGVEENRFASENVVGNPYPAGDERKAIALAMKTLFDKGCQVIRENTQELQQKAKPRDLGMAA